MSDVTKQLEERYQVLEKEMKELDEKFQTLVKQKSLAVQELDKKISGTSKLYVEKEAACKELKSILGIKEEKSKK